MTRANINFISQKRGEAPKTLFFYENGDQYPTGMRDFFHVLDLVNKPITKNRFIKWAKSNYRTTPKSVSQPKVYYTDGFTTDYSYVFEKDSAKVWEWDKSVFTGTRAEFIIWIKEQ